MWTTVAPAQLGGSIWVGADFCLATQKRTEGGDSEYLTCGVSGVQTSVYLAIRDKRQLLPVVTSKQKCECECPDERVCK